jgi:proteic killer suppression protein
MLQDCPAEWYTASGRYDMIETFRDRWLEDFFVDDIRHRRIPAELADRLFRKLQLIDDATSDSDLRSPPSNHFEKLSGKLTDYHTIRINQQWRLIFRWDGNQGVATDLYLDNHSYR